MINRYFIKYKSCLFLCDSINWILIFFLCSFVMSGIMPGFAYAFSSDQFRISAYDDRDFPLSAASVQSYIHRGDWEAPDVLLIVENEEWQESIDTIISAAHNDMTPVYILMNREDELHREKILHEQQGSNNILLHLSIDSPWVRDYGPLQLKTGNGSVKWMDFTYTNGLLHDDSVPDQLAGYIGGTIEQGDYLLDGGAVISNGNGLCAITDKSLEEAAVDLQYPEEFERFRDILGCTALAVLPALTGEATGHADIIAQFLTPETVVVAKLHQDDNDIIQAELEEAVKSLEVTAHKIDQPLKIIRLPLIVEDAFFYSYINGTRLKNTYLIPSFESVPSEIDHIAMNILQSALPDIRLAPIPADAIVQRGGAVHCITLGLDLPVNHDDFLFREDRTALLYSPSTSF